MKHKKVRGFLFVVGLVAGLSLIGFNPAVAAQKDAVELKFASHIPPQSGNQQVFALWAKELEEKSKGRVKVTFYPAASLVKPQDTYPATVKGICDIAFQVLVNDASRFSLNSIVDIPLMGWPSDEVATRIRRELFMKFPALQAEFKDVKVLWQVATSPRSMHFVDKAYRVPEELKGLKIIASGVSAKALKDMGASPIVLLPPDWYTSLERGIVKGACSGYTTIYNHKVHTLMPYHVDMNLAYLGQGAIMSKDTFNKLPPDVQKIIDDLEPWVTKKILESEHLEWAEAKDVMAKLGHTIVTLSPEELKKWYDGARPVQEVWVAENEAKGLPAKAVFEEAKKLIEKYSR
jgi:TRAP-type C4-dicarboxylate transport system substrate-binding protein